MEKEHHILDQQLPLPQDFEALKNKGLSFIKQFGSSQWTNLNQSDPGVTILEQVCYALTELGYCGDFPIEDILTQQNGKINYDSQFYTVGDILTTSPVTIDDYRKLIVDNFKEVINVMIYPVEKNGVVGNNYDVYLYLDRLAATDMYRNTDTIDFDQDIRLKVYILLNRYRNLESFSMCRKSCNRSQFFLMEQFISIRRMNLNIV